jgi:hypothetical protein
MDRTRVFQNSRDVHRVRRNPIFQDQMRREIAMPIDMDSIKDQEVVLWDNAVTRISRFWQEGPLVLVFLRHYG